MPNFRSGRVTTGAAGTIESTIPESGDEMGKRPRADSMDGSKCYKAKNLPLNLATPNGVPINFVNGYYVTADKGIQAYLKLHLGKRCELC